MHSRFFGVALLFAVPVCTPPVTAQSYPVKSVRVVVPRPPGGSNEMVARLVMQKVGEVFGKPFMINRRLRPNP